MAYNSVANARAFMGSASPWAKSFAGVVASSWVHTGASMFFGDELAQTGRSFVVLPKIGRSQLEALAFYDPTLERKDLNRILRADISGNFEGIQHDWKQFGKAFVHFTISPIKAFPLDVLDHHGVVRTVNELAQLDQQAIPTLRQFDEALGCFLVEAREECNRLLPLHGISRLPKLPDPVDDLPLVNAKGEILKPGRPSNPVVKFDL